MTDNEPVYIDALEIENVKRIKAFKMVCDGSALTIIGGFNKDGKTSVLDTICYLLGGERYRPTNLKRDNSLANPEMRLALSNGFVVERKGKNSTLKVTDPNGKTGGQALLKDFLNLFALDLPKFLQAKPTEKANILLQILGVGDQLKALEEEEDKAYNERLTIGQIADQKQKYADELTAYPDAPDVPVSASELIKEQQGILAKNGENQLKRQNVEKIKGAHEDAVKALSAVQKEMADVQDKKAGLELKLVDLARDYITATKTAKEIEDESTAEIEEKLSDIDAINVQVRANMDKERANEEAKEHKAKYDKLTAVVEKARSDKKALLDGANLPLPGLSVEKGELAYEGKGWDCMSGSDQLKVGAAIVQPLNPKCGFVLLDKLEAFDPPMLQEFGKYLESVGLRAIGTRVSKGNECSIIIEDGFSVQEGEKTFTPGEF